MIASSSRLMVAGVGLLMGPSGIAAQPPQVAHVVDGALGPDDWLPYGEVNARFRQGEVVLTVGEGFVPGKTQVVTWTFPYPYPKGAEGHPWWKIRHAGQVDTIEALAKKLEKGLPSLPAAPPAEARPCEIVGMDGQVIAWRVRSSGPQILWVGDPTTGWSRPVRVNHPRLYWLSRESATAGEIVWAFGVNFHRHNMEPVHTPQRVALRHVKTGAVRVTESAATHNGKGHDCTHVASFWVPPVEPGDYEVYVHPGWGNEYGWSNPGRLRIEAKGPADRPIIPASRFGARADDLQTDLSALQAALDEAAGQRATVFLGPGLYILDGTLLVPPGVELRGAGPEATILRVPRAGFPEGAGRFDLKTFRRGQSPHALAPAVWVRKDATIRDLAVEAGPFRFDEPPTVGSAILLWDPDGPAADILIRRCRIENYRELAHQPDAAGRVNWTGYHGAISAPTACTRVTVQDCLLRAGNGVGIMRGSRVRISNNRFEGLPGCVGHPLNMIGCRDSMVLENSFTNVATGPHFACTQNDASMVHNFIAWNTVEATRTGLGKDDGETMLVHPMDNFDMHGPVASATADTLTAVPGAAKWKWEPDKLRGLWCLIVAGRGMGQYRPIVANTADTIRLDPPWDIVPDQTSRFLVKVMTVENVFYGNVFRDCEGATGMYLDVGNIVADNLSDNAGGLDLCGGTFVAEGKRYGVCWWPSLYNQFINNKVYGRGGLVLHFRPNRHAATVEPPLAENALLGNIFRRNEVMRPDHGVQWAMWPYWNWGWSAQGTWFGGVLEKGCLLVWNSILDDPAVNYTGIQWTVIEGNCLRKARIGISVGRRARHTIVSENVFSEVEQPIEDLGVQTLAKDTNRVRPASP